MCGCNSKRTEQSDIKKLSELKKIIYMSYIQHQSELNRWQIYSAFFKLMCSHILFIISDMEIKCSWSEVSQD